MKLARLWQTGLLAIKQWSNNKPFKVVAIDIDKGVATLFCRGRGATFSESVTKLVDDPFIMQGLSSQHACWLGYCMGYQGSGGGEQYLNNNADRLSQCYLLQCLRDGSLVCFDQLSKQHFVAKPAELAQSARITHFSTNQAFYIGLLSGEAATKKSTAKPAKPVLRLVSTGVQA